ncbi:MAG: hypothetical protein P8H56_04115 [Crocinitomicaceae bacterium]|nr:hypothetical protein [Crocinitomicaceae bacterium]MDG1657748.1 hypothetical protein [Crocinitomicaceae bacterium]
MKKIILLSVLLITFNSSAQLGVCTIDPNDLEPIGQWFSVRGEDQENWIYYLNETSITESLLNSMLEPWGLTVLDGELDKDGDLYWFLDNENGYDSTVYLLRSFDEGGSYIYIYVEEN